jgi:hypothetical protein
MRLVVRRLQTFPAFCAGRPVPVSKLGELAAVDTADVVALGRFGVHGDAVARLLVRCADGTEYQVMHLDQADHAARLWLNRLTRAWKDMPRTDRYVGWGEVWHPLTQAR